MVNKLTVIGELDSDFLVMPLMAGEPIRTLKQKISIAKKTLFNNPHLGKGLFHLRSQPNYNTM